MCKIISDESVDEKEEDIETIKEKEGEEFRVSWVKTL